MVSSVEEKMAMMQPVIINKKNDMSAIKRFGKSGASIKRFGVSNKRITRRM